MVPVGDRQAASVIWQGETADMGSVYEFAACIEECAIAFVAAPGGSLADLLHKGRPGGRVAFGSRLVLPVERGRRHDLSPEETS